MPLYTVLAPPPRGEEKGDPVDTVFVKDGFCWPALFFPEIWLIYRRMWLVLLLDLAAVVVAVGLEQATGSRVVGAAATLARLLFALEGNSLRRWTLYRRGYRMVDVVAARNAREADIRYFHEHQAPRHDPSLPPRARLEAAAQGRTPGPVGAASAEAGDVVGLFPSPGATP
jgi:hypothetical protein